MGDHDAAHLRWVHALDQDGNPVTLTLAETVAQLDTLTVVTDGPGELDSLTGVATRRLLHAIVLAAEADGVSPQTWVGEHAAQFDPFDPVAPFAQNVGMRDHLDQTLLAPEQLPIFTTMNGPVLLNHQHSQSGSAFTPEEAMRLLLVRQAFGTAQKQPFPAKIYGPGASDGKHAVCGPRPYLWVDTGNLATSLAASQAPGAVGEFMFTWPTGQTPGTLRAPSGQAEVLTWPSRTLLLAPDSDGMVRGLTYGNGCVLPEDLSADLAPNTVYLPGQKTDDPWVPARATPVPLTVRRMLRGKLATDTDGRLPLGRTHGAPLPQVDGALWRLLAGWVLAGDRGLLGALRATPIVNRHGWVLRWSGLAANKGRVDGVMDVSVPVPTVSDDVVTGLLDLITAAYRTYHMAIGSAVYSTREMAPDDTTLRAAHDGHTRLDSALAALVPPVVTGDLQVADADDLAQAAIRDALATAHARFGSARNPLGNLTLENT